MFFDRGTFWVLPLAYSYPPKSARAYSSPNLTKIITFAAAPLVLTPFVRNQAARLCQANGVTPSSLRRKAGAMKETQTQRPFSSDKHNICEAHCPRQLLFLRSLGLGLLDSAQESGPVALGDDDRRPREHRSRRGRYTKQY